MLQHGWLAVLNSPASNCCSASPISGSIQGRRKTYSNAFASTYGLAKVYAAQGNREAAKQAEENLAKTWIGNRSLLQLSKL